MGKSTKTLWKKLSFSRCHGELALFSARKALSSPAKANTARVQSREKMSNGNARNIRRRCEGV